MTGVDVGVLDVQASLDGILGSTSLVVGPAIVLAVELTPADGSVAAGTGLQYDAVAIWSDGAKVDVTATAAWGASPGAVATAAAGGLVTGASAGGATVSATSDGVTGSAALAVTSATLSSIVVSPATPRVPLGIEQPFVATGIFSDHTAQDLTAQVTWTSTATGVVSISGSGVATPLSVGAATIEARLGGITGSTTLAVTGATLVSVAVMPPSATFAAGTTFQYVATATYSDGSTQDMTGLASWSSSDTASVTVAGGLAAGVTAGGATLGATVSGVHGTAAATVTSALLTSLAISPSGATVPAGLVQQLAATGAFSDGSTQDLTASATWASSATTVAAVSNAPGREGLVTALAAGSATIGAAVGAVNATAPLEVSAATLASLDVQPVTTTIAAGRAVQYRATGTYTDGSTRDLTTQVVWSSSDVAAAIVSSAAGTEGLAKGVGVGTATITAELGSVSRTASLQVVAPVLVSVAVSPPSASVAKGLTQAFTAAAVYSDGSTQDVTGTATWMVLDADVATASGNVVRGVAVGVTQVEATFGGLTGSAGLAVGSPVVVQVTVSPSSASVAVGTSVQYGASAIYSDGAKVDVTSSAVWAATPEAVATITPAGLATGLSVGSATVSARALGVTAFDPLTVTSATLQDLAISPTAPTVPDASVPQQFTATGLFSDGTREDLTTQVAWDASGPATITAAGLATPTAPGPAAATITASRGGLSASTTLTVAGVTLSSVAIDQPGATVATGTTFPFTATATYGDGSTQDVTGLASWTSLAPAIVTVSNFAGSKGLATGAAPGLGDVQVSFGGQWDVATVTVTAADLVSVAVTNVPTTALPKGMTWPLAAVGTFSDGSTQDLTAAAGWTSSVTSVAAVSNAAGQEGVVTAVGGGSTTITAAYGGFAGTAAIDVSNATVTSIDVSAVTTTVPTGYKTQFSAKAHYSDGTTREVTSQATWASGNPAVATVSNAGLASGISQGSTTISATLSGTRGSAPIDVFTATLQSIAVTPNPWLVSVKGTQQMTATGTFRNPSNGALSTLDITRQCSWSSSARKKALVSKTGLVTGVAAGTSIRITAKKTGAGGTSAFATGSVN